MTSLISSGPAAHHHAVLGEAPRGRHAGDDAGGGAAGGGGGDGAPETVRAADDAGEWKTIAFR